MAGPLERARWEFGDQDLEGLLAEARRYKGDSLWSDAWRRLRRNRTAFLCLLFLAAFGLLSFLALVEPSRDFSGNPEQQPASESA